MNKLVKQKFVFFNLILLMITFFYSVGFSDNLQESKIEPIEKVILFSDLNSIVPHVIHFSSGKSIPAPNLDERKFYHPDSLIQSYKNIKKKNKSFTLMDSISNRKYIILSQIFINVNIEENSDRDDDGNWSKPKHKVIDLKEKAKNIKPYLYIKDKQFNSEFSRLLGKAEGMGADGIIEVFCGENIKSFTIKSQENFIPEFGLNYKLYKKSGWKIIGLAIQFIEE